jgi:hypothetical protein
MFFNQTVAFLRYRLKEVNTKEVEDRLIYYNKTITHIYNSAAWQISPGSLSGFFARYKSILF